MGLFSFLKSAGAKLLDKKAEENTAEAKTAAPTVLEALQESTRKSKISLMEAAVRSSGLPVENLSIDFQDDTVTVYGQVETTTAKEKVILILGNIEGVASVDDRLSVVTPEPESVFYEVKKGDTLSKIAKEHYGDMMKYNIIFEANKPMLTSADLIYPGQVLRIPALK
ncbi:MAG: peptidoglycan-binding protein LysM [Saprospiraceae bacterium]|nr:peptidoglycan-binding protein LysM [Saprospiraceae bacterium]